MVETGSVEACGWGTSTGVVGFACLFVCFFLFVLCLCVCFFVCLFVCLFVCFSGGRIICIPLL